MEVPEESLAGGGDDAGRAVPVVDPAGHGLPERGQHDGRPDDGDGQAAALPQQHALRQGLREGVRVWPAGYQLRCQLLHEAVVHPRGARDYLLGVVGRRVDRLLDVLPVAVAVRRRHVDQRLFFPNSIQS